MTALRFHERTPFDILVRNFFESAGAFAPAAETKISHPVDIYEDPDGIHIEVACTGIDKKDIEVLIEYSSIRIKHEKANDQDTGDRTYHAHGISRRSFNLGYRFSSRFDLSKADAKFNNGLLLIDIPFAEESKPRALKIK
jgi:HSP20 family protein